MAWSDQSPWAARDKDRRAAMRRIEAAVQSFLAKGMKWEKVVEAILTEIDGQSGRGGRVGEAHLPEIQS